MHALNRAACFAAFLHFAAQGALAHSDGNEGGQWWLQWTFPPLVMSGLGLLAAFYTVGWSTQHRRRKARPLRRDFARRRLLLFASSLTVLLLALASPIDAYSEKLAWVHMLQHMLLILVAAPLYILAAPAQAMLWALPKKARVAVADMFYRFGLRRLPYYSFSLPLIAWLLFALTLWTWHLPKLYGAALRSPLLHDVQHLAFFGTAALFWHTLLHPLVKRRINPGAGVLYIFLASLHSMLLGVAMWLSPVVWYEQYERSVVPFGITALQDQQLAGYLMWMPACSLYGAVAVALFLGWLRGDAAADEGSRVRLSV